MGQDLSVGTFDTKDLKAYTAFSAKQVEMIKERFELLCDEDQSVDKDTFAKLMKVPLNEADKLFNFFDMDQSGRVDSYEFICGLTMLSSSSLSEKADIIFGLYDFDNSKVITLDEMIIMIKTTLSSLNSIAKKPPPKLQDVEKKAKEIIARWDTNHDGKISLREFQSIISKDPGVLQLLLNYGLITKDEFRPDFGATEDFPDCDSDLENEIGIDDDVERDERRLNIKQGFEQNVKETDDGMFEVEAIQQGDQFMAVKPATGTIKNSVPRSYKPTKGESDPPEATLELEYVHGIRVDDTRNNLFYSPTGEVVYHTAAVGIVLNQKTNTQKFFFEHRDDIRCIAVHQNLVATGEIGPKPIIAIWDCTTMETKAIIEGTLKKGIAHVCFSNDGKKLAATAMDDDHCVAVYDLNEVLNPNPKKAVTNPGLLSTGKGPRGNVLAMRFEPSDQQIVAAGVKELNFISFAGGIKCAPATGMGKNSQSLLCIGFIDQTIITGALDGSLLVWKGKSLSNTIKAHTGKVATICSRQAAKGIISGGADGLAIIWDQNLKKLQTYDMNQAQINSLNPRLNALAEDAKGNVLIGTRGSEIVEMTNNTPKVIMRGHYDLELWGLAVHPSKGEYATFGQEGMLAIWDISKRTQKLSKKLEYPGKVAAYSPDAKFLAVGCENGFVLILDPKNLTVLNTLKDRTKEVTELKFSPNGEYLAAGSRDTEVFIYNVSKNFSVPAKARGHHSTITHFDFSEDSQTLQSNCTSYELLYFNTQNGKRDPSGASKNRDERWASMTLVISWFTQGIWPPCSDGSDINSTDRHPKDPIIATADDFSKVKLFKYPVAQEKASFVKYVGHSSHVTNCRFSGGAANYLLTTGGNDKGVFQWKYTYDQKGAQQATDKHELVNEEELAEDLGEAPMFEQEVVAAGDQMLAVKPFKGEVDHSWPTGYKKPKDAATAPDGNLKLKYCHGTRLFDAQDTVKYGLNSKNIVFAAAALGVVMDPNTKAQQFFQMHEEDIISISLHPNGTICATGQMAAKGKAKLIDIFVWDINTKQVLANLKGFHLRAVCLLQFSPDGSKLASVGQDDDNSLAIYDWQKSRLIGTAKVDKAKVMAVAWASETDFMTCGLKHVKVYTMNGPNISAKRGVIQEDQRPDAFYCCTYSGANQTYYTGTNKGNIIPFKGGSSMKTTFAHEGGVFTVIASKTNLFSGGKDGKVVTWSWASGLAKVAVFWDAASISKFNPAVRSLDLKADGTTLLVGTRGSEIYEVAKGGQSKLMLQGHFDGETWGCAVSPKGNRYVTSGGDFTIRLWDADKFCMIAHLGPMTEDVRALDFSSDGSFVIAGGFNGTIYLLNADTLQIESQTPSSFKKKDQWIEDIKISPDCNMVAFGAHGGASAVEFMGVDNRKLVKKGTMNAGLTSALTHLDWSVDSQFLVINSQAYELKFVNAGSKRPQAASASKDIEWATWTCVLGFPVQGIFPGVDGTDVNSTCRSHNKKIIATADDFGKVNLFKYPCVVPKAQSKGYIGHSSHVTKVKFTYNDGKIISTGGNDKCVLVWDTDFGTGNQGGDDYEEEKEEEQEENYDNGDDEDLDGEFIQRKVKKNKYGIAKKEESKKAEVAPSGGGLFEIETVEAGDEFMAIKPWIGQIKNPTGYLKPPQNQNKAPNVTLTLDYVHGYRSKDSRNNLKYLKSGNIVYHAAGVGIVLDTTTTPFTQRFFTDHTDDVTAIDVHPNGSLVATGQVGAKPLIFIWDSNTMQTVQTMKTGLKRGIAGVAFSPSGEYLACVDVNDDHHITICATNSGVAVASVEGDTAIIADIEFLNESNFVTVGPKHYKFWTFENKSISSKKGSFGKSNNVLTCCHMRDNNILAGAMDGSLQVWTGNSIRNTYSLHKGAIDAISSTNALVATGGRDGKINILDASNFSVVLAYDFGANVKTSVNSQIRSVYFSADNKTLLVGTYGSEIYELQSKDIKFGPNTKFTPKEITKGHYTPNQKWLNEVWGLAVFSDNDRYATCSDDATLRIWSASQKKQLKWISVNIDAESNKLGPDATTGDLQESAKARALEISPDDQTIVLGMKDGTVKIFDANSLKQIKHIKDAKKWISDIKFSPDGQRLAIGSHDNSIYLYTVPEYKKTGVFNKNTSYVTHFDWSTDSQFLQSNSGDYNLLFFKASDAKMVAASSLKDEKWATFTCVLGFPVQGIWPPAADGTDINSLDRSHNPHPGGYHLIALGDDFSKVRVLRCPSIQKGSEAISGKGHSSHVTNVRFSPQDDMIFSVGGEDNCVFQWKIEHN